MTGDEINGIDPLDEERDDDQARMDVLDRLASYAPAPERLAPQVERAYRQPQPKAA